METLIVNIDSSENVQVFLEIIRKLEFVKSVKTTFPIAKKEDNIVNEADEKYNWIIPDRPANEKEIEKLIAEMEIEENSGINYSTDEAKAMTMKKLLEWQKEQ